MLRELRKRKDLEIIKAECCPDHIYMFNDTTEVQCTEDNELSKG